MLRADRRAFLGLTSARRIRQQPGLDGLRGLAVAAVVVFHSGLDWLPGGYLGVSLFFTLSGVVIGTVLLHDVSRAGFVSLRHFWLRRARRLYPAAWLVLAAVAVVRVTSTVLSATSELDIVASWLQFANWHFLYDGASYKELFDGPSAVLHFWSLAIEEQLYLVVGVVAAVVARESRHPDRLLGVVAAIGAAVSFALPFAFRLGVDRVYYGTDTRAGELFVGLVIAAVIAAPSRRRWLLRRARVIGGIAVLGLAVTAVLWLRVPAGDPWLRSGLLPLTALASCVVVLGALVPGGPVWVLGCLPPLRWLGGISYALYLIHFPVFVIADRLQPDPRLIDTIGLVAISIVLAVVSGRLLEWPVRRRRMASAGPPRRCVDAGRRHRGGTLRPGAGPPVRADPRPPRRGRADDDHRGRRRAVRPVHGRRRRRQRCGPPRRPLPSAARPVSSAGTAIRSPSRWPWRWTTSGAATSSRCSAWRRASAAGWRSRPAVSATSATPRWPAPPTGPRSSTRRWP